MRPRYVNYSKEVHGFRAVIDQDVPLVSPGQSQSGEEEQHTRLTPAPTGFLLPSSATSVPGDLVLCRNEELHSVSAKKFPSPTGSGDGPPGLVGDSVRRATLHLQSLVTERETCEEVLTTQISGFSCSSSGEGEVEQLLENSRQERQRILRLIEQVQQLTGVPQSRRLRQGLDTWQENIQELQRAKTTTTNYQDITSLTDNMVESIGSIRTLIWTLASTSIPASY